MTTTATRTPLLIVGATHNDDIAIAARNFRDGIKTLAPLPERFFDLISHDSLSFTDEPNSVSESVRQIDRLREAVSTVISLLDQADDALLRMRDARSY